MRELTSFFVFCFFFFDKTQYYFPFLQYSVSHTTDITTLYEAPGARVDV